MGLNVRPSSLESHRVSVCENSSVCSVHKFFDLVFCSFVEFLVDFFPNFRLILLVFSGVLLFN